MALARKMVRPNVLADMVYERISSDAIRNRVKYHVELPLSVREL